MSSHSTRPFSMALAARPAGKRKRTYVLASLSLIRSLASVVVCRGGYRASSARYGSTCYGSLL
jgi:hypothetical protein